MKPNTALLLASLVGNCALVAVLATRSAAPTAQTSRTPDAPILRAENAGGEDALRSALTSGNAAALAAAGVTPEVTRELLLGRSLTRAAERIRAARANQPKDDRWWRLRNTAGNRELQLQQRRELSEALLAAFGEDFGLSANADSAQLAFLPAEKRDALRRITQDYEEMMAKFGAGGVQLPSDRERLKLLRAERDRDIAALLTPEERAAYELRTSPTANAVRARFGDGLETEEDYRKVYALQKAFDDAFPLDASGRLSGETLRQRGEAQRQLQDDIRAALGEEKYSALRRATDPDLRTIESLASRLNLPAATTDRVATARESLAAESQRINADASLTPQQRRAQIQELGTRGRQELARTLGPEAAEAYAQRSPWVGMLQNGMAYSTTPPAGSPGLALGGAPSVHPVPPAGAAGPGTTRQMFTIAAPGTFDGINADPLAQPSGVQIMTFGTGASETPGEAAGARRIMVAPGKAPPATTTPPAPSP